MSRSSMVEWLLMALVVAAVLGVVLLVGAAPDWRLW